jgi:hypothetical protein
MEGKIMKRALWNGKMAFAGLVAIALSFSAYMGTHAQESATNHRP